MRWDTKEEGKDLYPWVAKEIELEQTCKRFH